GPSLAAAPRASPQAVDGSPVPHLTDRAVIEGAGVAGLDESDGAPGWHVERDLPLEPSRGYHAVLGRIRGGHLLSVKGAPEVVLPRCTRWRGSSGDAQFDARARAQVDRAVERLARTGYRVLAVAERDAVGRSDLDDEAVAGLRLVV